MIANCIHAGVFGVPLELLVEREGADSLLGASRASLRIPSFIDDVISSMKQMGMSKHFPLVIHIDAMGYDRYVRRGHLPKEREHSSAEPTGRNARS
jgi:hypothetical protein